MKNIYMGKSQKLYQEAKKYIPGGTQLLSKRPEMFLPSFWPAYYKKAKGCEVWDLDGKKYIDMSYMGIGACVLGYADPDVNEKVKQTIDDGSMSTLNCPEEYELAKLLCELHPWAENVRYARGGGEAMAIAVRLARAKTQKDMVLFCGYHGWHDWYLSANLADDKALDGHLISGLSPRGVPRGLKGTAIPFQYNDTRGFLKVFEEYKNNIGAIVMEPIRNYYPNKDFIDAINHIKEKYKIPLIVDEVSAGFRLNAGGAHLKLGFEPDIAVFAKAMSNGYPMAAIIGKQNAMQIAQDTFISSTYWTEKIGPVAALACIKKFKQNNVSQHLIKVGKKIQEGWRDLAKKYRFNIDVSGIYPMGHFNFKENPLVFKTLFTQLMLEKGFLATNAFYASYAHKQVHLNLYLDAVEKTFSKISLNLKRGNIEKCLKGPVCHAGFQRLN